MLELTKIHILYTGGTIGMAAKSDCDPQLVPKSLHELLTYVQGWNDCYSTVEGIYLKDRAIKLTFNAMNPVDSSNITPNDWVQIADNIAAVYHEHDGFVILHGTDTMAYTASGLAFMFENLAKPVVLTGSQLPISDMRTDAIMNLVNAVEIAAWKATGLACIPEVVICFADRILRGCRSCKVSSRAWAGFDSPNYPHLGEIGERIRIYPQQIRAIPTQEQYFRVNRALNTQVLDISLNPGLKPSQLAFILHQADIDAVVLRTYGAGNAPDNDTFLDVIETAVVQGKIILTISQCLQGAVEMGVYATSSSLLQRGVISGLDMTAEAALAKLYYLLATQSTEACQKYLQLDLRGELTEPTSLV